MANNIDVLDAGSSTQTVKTTDNAGVHTPHHNVDSVVGITAKGQATKADSLPVTMASDQEAVPVAIAGTGVTVKRAAINLSASGNLVAAVASNKVKVLGLFLMADADLTVTIESGSGGTDLIPAIPFAAAGNGFVLPMAPVGSHWIETAVNTALYADITGTGNLTGVVVYHEQA